LSETDLSIQRKLAEGDNRDAANQLVELAAEREHIHSG
jgi:hypothetical protein